jgi:polyisoprenoid-binding protein YceI
MRRVKWLIGGVAALVVLAVGGTFVYINVVKADAPDRLTVGSRGDGDVAAPPTGGIEGTWRPGPGSQFGYRVNEVLFGQRTIAVGRTDKVTGHMTIEPTRVTEVDLSVDMASVTSDQSRRDNQFQGRIMDVSRYPTATFELTSPIAFATVPADASPMTVKATGDLTLRGTTRPVTVDLQARRNGARIEVSGTIPITFAEWGIPNPSFGPASTEDHGDLELLVLFERA